MQKCCSHNKRSDAHGGRMKKFRIDFVRDKPERAIQRAFIYMD
jgi:hypothetical protein